MKAAKKTNNAEPAKNHEQTGADRSNDRAPKTKENKHPIKPDKREPELYIAGHALGQCPPHIRAKLKEILSWLGKTIFDKDGFRKIERADLCEAEWNFSEISESREAYDVHEYEYFRECESAYNYRADYLRPSRSRESWLRERAEFQKKWPAPPYLGLESGLLTDFFPLPYLLIPAEVQAKIKENWEPPSITNETPVIGITYSRTPLVEEMNLQPFKGQSPFDAVSFPQGNSTYHCLRIRWGIGGIEKIEAELMAWLQSIRPKDLKSKRGRATDTRIQDGLAQLAAWRARRAGMSQADYSDLLSKAEVTGYGSVRKYPARTAFRKATIGAQKRITALQKQLTAEAG